MNLNERLDLAHEILDYYKLNNKIIVSCHLEKDVLAFFNFDTGDIELCDDTRIESDEDFILSVLHEAKHAMDARAVGLANYGLKYERKVMHLENRNLDSYKHHIDEIKAEQFAQTELKHWL